MHARYFSAFHYYDEKLYPQKFVRVNESRNYTHVENQAENS